MKLLLPISILVVLGIGGWYIFTSSQPETEQNPASKQSIQPTLQSSVDYSASFAIFTNGTFRVFTAPMYHNQSNDAFIESLNPNIVRVKKTDVTWEDFFKTLPMKLSRDCLTTGTGQTFCTGAGQTLKFYINGKLDSNALNRTINNGDQLLVSYGAENDAEIEKQLQQIPSI